jgi:Domain of unknown function (DUF4430)
MEPQRNTNYKVLFLTVLLCAGALFVYKNKHKGSEDEYIQPIPQKIEETQKKEAPKEDRVQIVSIKPAEIGGGVQENKTSTTETNPEEKLAMLLVEGTPYTISAGEEVILEEEMMRLKERNSRFTFTQKEYPGLGQFVESIGGKKSAGGEYWIFYVNGKESSTGVSTTIIHEGDVIEWKYKKSY